MSMGFGGDLLSGRTIWDNGGALGAATTPTTHDQAIRKIGQLRLDEASLVMIIPVPRNTHKAGVHGRQFIKHVF